MIFGVIETEGINISLHREVRHWADSASCGRDWRAAQLSRASLIPAGIVRLPSNASAVTRLSRICFESVMRETPTSDAIAPTLSVGASTPTVACQRTDRLPFGPRINGKTVTSDEYEKLPAAEQEHFMCCPDCREMFDFRSEEDVVFHLAHHKLPRPASRIRNPDRFQQS